MSPNQQLASDSVVAKDVVFVLDTSGSMAQDHKLDQAKRALSFCVQNLNSGDRFELVRFSTEAEALFGRLVEASPSRRAEAERFVEQLRPIGGTAIADALRIALDSSRELARAGRPQVVVFLTDGKPTIGTTDTDQIVDGVRQALGERTVRVFSFGIGIDINTHLLDRITEVTRAASQYVLPQEDLELKVSSFYSKINQPVLSDVKLSVGGGVRVSALAPNPLPDLFRGEQLMVLGRYVGSGAVTIALEGMVNGKRQRYRFQARFPATARDNGFVARLWATRRVGFLLDQIRLHGENAELRDEVTELARRYGIVTPYTAYLIVEDEARRAVPVTARTLQTIDRDSKLKEEALRMYDEVNSATSGDAAVGGAQAYEALKSAKQAAAPAAANRFAARGQAGGAEGSQRVTRVVESLQSQFVNGRTFYQNGREWIDAQVQAARSGTA